MPLGALQTRDSFSLHMFPGNHFFLHSAKERLLTTLFYQLQMLVCAEGDGQLAQHTGSLADSCKTPGA